MTGPQNFEKRLLSTRLKYQNLLFSSYEGLHPFGRRLIGGGCVRRGYSNRATFGHADRGQADGCLGQFTVFLLRRSGWSSRKSCATDPKLGSGVRPRILAPARNRCSWRARLAREQRLTTNRNAAH